ncbi:MAG: prepilin peptidase [Patescibacteria group bacterium]
MLFIFELLVVFLLGLCVGSFLNVIIFRLHRNEQWQRGRSHCGTCNTALTIKDLIPLVSFLVLKGTCRYCKAPLSPQYPFVELAMGVLVVVAYLAILSEFQAQSLSMILAIGTLFPVLVFVKNIFFLGILLVIFVTDLRWFAIYDSVVLTGCALALAAHLLMPPLFSPHYILPAWLNLGVAALVPTAFFGAQYVVSSGKWIGGGDILLGGMMGLMLGWPQVLVALFIAYCTGSIIGIALIAAGKKSRGSEVPFGTFLTAATATMLLIGDPIMAFVNRTLLL